MTFIPDSCFGLLKQKMRRTPIECLDDIVNVVNQSATVNRAHLVGAQDGKVLVPTYIWLSYFTEHFKKIPHIKDYHHFTASSETPGVVTCKKYSDSSELILSTTYSRILISSQQQVSYHQQLHQKVYLMSVSGTFMTRSVHFAHLTERRISHAHSHLSQSQHKHICQYQHLLPHQLDQHVHCHINLPHCHIILHCPPQKEHVPVESVVHQATIAAPANSNLK